MSTTGQGWNWPASLSTWVISPLCATATRADGTDAAVASVSSPLEWQAAMPKAVRMALASSATPFMATAAVFGILGILLFITRNCSCFNIPVLHWEEGRYSTPARGEFRWPCVRNMRACERGTRPRFSDRFRPRMMDRDARPEAALG